MSVLEALLLGVVQGLTEFLPVSSSGHLVLGQALLGIDAPGVAFEVVLHLATLTAVLWVYRRRVGELLLGMTRGSGEAWRYAGLIALASVPAGLAGFFGRDTFERAFGEPVLAAGMLLVSGFLAYSIHRTAAAASEPRPRAGQSFWIGVAQAAAILPGISRSGATVAMGSWLGVEVVKMAEFSFLMSVPAILGAGVLQLGGPGGASPISAPALATGFVAAALAGVAAIRLFVHMLRSGTFHRFAWYCWTAGSAYLVAALLQPALR